MSDRAINKEELKKLILIQIRHAKDSFDAIQREPKATEKDIVSIDSYARGVSFLGQHILEFLEEKK